MRLVALLTPSQARLHHILPPDAASVDQSYEELAVRAAELMALADTSAQTTSGMGCVVVHFRHLWRSGWPPAEFVQGIPAPPAAQDG